MITNINLSKQQNKVFIRAPKRLDAFTAPFLYEDLEEKIGKGICLVLDLSQTQFIDPVGADTIKEGLIRCKQYRVRLTLKGVKPPIKVALQQLGVLQYSRQKKRAKLHTPSGSSRHNVSTPSQQAS